ncbi:Putative bacilysin exporter BacE [Nodularia sphaerocarpa UHCC 0038]|nr:Putative bacilysin exporter BacE [Nodularia sphaerocarpa UHCC 0038]
MMQPSELDRKILPLSPNTKKQNRASAPTVKNHLSAVPKSTNSPEQPKQAVSQNEENRTLEIPETEVAKESAAVVNGNGRSLSATESPKLDGSGANVVSTSANGQQQGFLPVLRNPNFLALWGGQVFCQIADKVYLVLMIGLINTQFQGSDQSISGWVSALMMAFTIPAVLFGSVAGVFVDRWSKKTVLVTTNVWRGILVLSIPFLLWLTDGWQPIGGMLPVGFAIILGVTFFVSTLTQFFAPAEQTTIPLVVEEQHLLSANSLYTTTMMASVIVGFAIGEPLLAIADTLWLQVGGNDGLGKELLVGGSYAIAGFILLLLATKETPHHPDTEFPHVFSDLRDGFSYLKANSRVRNALLQLTILFSVFAALTVLAVRMAEIIPNLKASQFGFLLAFGGIGMAVGATILGQFGQRFSYSELSLCGCLGMAGCLIGLSIFTTQLVIILLLIALLGIFGALVGIPMQTAIQTETPPEMRGKVFGLQNNVINIALTLPLALAGVAETFMGLQAVFLVLAVTVFSGGILTFYNSH